MERDDNTGLSVDGRLAGQAQGRVCGDGVGGALHYISSDAWVTAFQSCCLWTGKDLGLGLGEGKVKGCKDLCS